MYLFDTNVVSALRRQEREPEAFLEWARSIDFATIWISVITVLEIEQGVARLEHRDPQQGAVLRRWFNGPILSGYAGRILPVDLPVVRRAAPLQVPDPRPNLDALIAATALVHDFTVVTRNIRDFAPMGVPVFNPWEVA